MAVHTQPRERVHARDNARRRAEHRHARAKWIWGGIVAFVIVAAMVAFFAVGGNKVETAAGVEQTRPVTITGTSLPELGSGTDNAIGQLIPEVTGASFDGAPVSIAHDGRAKLVLFVAHWCPHCQAEVPRLVSLAKNGQIAGVDVIGIPTSTTNQAPNYPPSAWLAREKWPFPVLLDTAKGKAGQAYGLSAFPYFVFVDASGKVVGRTSGEIQPAQVEAIFDALAKGQPLPIPGAGASSSASSR